MKNSYFVELLHSYVKNLNLNVTNPLSLVEYQVDPGLDISPLGIKTRSLGKSSYEVVADCSIEVNNEQGESLLDLTIEYGGIFKITEAEDQLKKLIYVDCASIIYPFLRAELHSVSCKLGMKPIILPIIDFEEQFYKIASRNKNLSRRS